METGDDAAVWRIAADRALVATADFITPIVDDARTWGRIAATNSISDVYAMGGRPLFALNLVGWNTTELATSLLEEVLTGAADIAVRDGFVTVGGHTVDDPEPKFGLAVVGEVHPERLLSNRRLSAGEVLVLTKPLGTGVIATALKRGEAAPEVVEGAVTEMVRSNAAACSAALESGARGATDVTGFGLLGHLAQMALASGVDAIVEAELVPVLPGARPLAASGVVPGGTQRNRASLENRLEAAGIDEVTLTLLADAQTSGGLLFGAEPGAAEEGVSRLRACGHQSAVIGTVTAGTGRVRVV